MPVKRIKVVYATLIRYFWLIYKTKRYSLDVNTYDDGAFSYQEDTELWIPVDQGIIHHTDQNTLEKVSD